LGIDLNAQYIRDAERRQTALNGNKHFVAADAAKFSVKPGDKFDFILVNSFLHHIDDATTRSILTNLSELLTEDGHLHSDPSGLLQLASRRGCRGINTMLQDKLSDFMAGRWAFKAVVYKEWLFEGLRRLWPRRSHKRFFPGAWRRVAHRGNSRR
jgi:SAM-dependent methyltransferase